MTAVGRLRRYLQTLGYLRPDQLAHYAYRRVLRGSSKPHRALDRPRVRERTIAFPQASGTKVLDRSSLADRDARPAGAYDWHTNELWRPLRIQIHYFDYLNDPNRSEVWKRAIVSEWMAHHPRAKGDAWTAYPVSLRMVNWIKFFLRLAPADRDASAIARLYEHALWLENNLELHILANHYLKNAKALLFAGLFFAGADAERWRTRGLEIFLAQMREQFLPDGGHYERSPMYHAISLEDVLDVYTYLRSGATPQPASTLEALRARAVAALDFMDGIALPDGALPLFNDSCDGVGPSPAELFAYARATLGYEPARVPDGLQVRAFESSGYFVIRDGESALAIDCGPLGPEYQPGHGHCDALSYELSLRGERVVVDTGVFDYEPNAQRRYARGTAAHNTVQIDGAEQSEVWDVFRVARRAHPIAPALVLAGPREASFAGAHDGYRRSPARAVHHRTVRYEGGEWIFLDRLDGSGTHRLESRVHLHPRLRTERTNEGVRMCGHDGRLVATLRPSPGVDLRVERGPYHPHFGASQERDVVVMACNVALPATMSYTIVPA